MENGRKKVYNIVEFRKSTCDCACDATLRTRFSYEGDQTMSWLCAADPAEFEVLCQDNSTGEDAVFYLCAQHVLWVKHNGKIFIKDENGDICLLVPTINAKVGLDHPEPVRLFADR